MNLKFYLATISCFLVSYTQTGIIFSQSPGKLNTGESLDLMRYDFKTKKVSLLYKASVKKRGEYSASISPDGSKIIVNSYQFGGWKLAVADYQKGKIGRFRRFTSRPHYEYNAEWSNDGNFVAYEEFNWAKQKQNIFISDKRGKLLKQLTSSDTGDENPSWTRTDDSIVFSSGRTGNYDVYIKKVKGEKTVNLSHHPSYDFAASASKESDAIAFLSNRDGFVKLYLMDTSGKNLRCLTPALNFDKLKNLGSDL